MPPPHKVLTHLKTDSRAAKLLRGKFENTKGMKNVETGLGLRLRSKVDAALRELRENGYILGPRAYSVGISVLGRVGLLRSAEELWEETEPMRKIKTQTNLGLYNAILHARLRKVQSLSEAKDKINSLFSKMNAARIYRDQYTYNTALKGMASSGGYADCKQFIERMKNSSISPDLITYNTLLTGCRTEDDLSDGMGVLEAAGIAPNANSYLAVVSALIKSNKVERAVSWWEKSLKDGIKDPRQVKTIAVQLASRPDPYPLKMFLQRAIDKGITPCIESYHLAMLAFTGESLKEVTDYYRTILATYTPKSRTYIIFIDAAAAEVKRLSPNHPHIPKLVSAAKIAFSTSLRDSLPNGKLYVSLARLYHHANDVQGLKTLHMQYYGAGRFPKSDELDHLFKTCGAEK